MSLDFFLVALIPLGIVSLLFIYLFLCDKFGEIDILDSKEKFLPKKSSIPAKKNTK